MADTKTLESIASMLPESRRERYLHMVARFQSVPEDDEYLQILEAIGFMTLLLKEVPAEIAQLLEGASPIQETHLGLCKLVKEAVTESIPSYEDLKRMADRFENHELGLKQLLQSQSQKKRQGQHSGFALTTTFLLGTLSGLGLALLFPAILP